MPSMLRMLSSLTLALLAAAASLATAAQPAGDIKWHPGHYMLVYIGASPSMRERQLEELGDESAVLGAQVRYYWADLEPRKGVYDFSLVEGDLARLEANGKRLVIQILDRRFNSGRTDGIVPEYLTSEPAYNGGLAKTRTGYIARVWEPAVMDRLIALYEALGKRFDSEPYVEGITSEETATGFGRERPAGFDEAALAAQLKRWVTAVRAAWPRTNVFFYTNWMGDDLEELIAWCAEQRCGAGGPDVFPPPQTSTAGDRILRGANGAMDYRGRIPIAYAVQVPELGGRKGDFSPQQLFEYAYDTLRANYIFWMRNTATGGRHQQWSTGILPFLRSIDGKVHTECPSSWSNACATQGTEPRG